MALFQGSSLAFDIPESSQDVIQGKTAVTTAGSLQHRFYRPVHYTLANAAINRGTGANEARASYCGVASKLITTIDARWYVNAAAAVVWAEMAIATGLPAANTGCNLVFRGFANVASQWSTTGAKTATITLSNPISAGEDVWFVLATDNGTMQYRVSEMDMGQFVDLGFLLKRAATQPSLNMGSSLAFVTDIAGVTAPTVAFMHYE